MTSITQLAAITVDNAIMVKTRRMLSTIYPGPADGILIGDIAKMSLGYAQKGLEVTLQEMSFESKKLNDW